MAECAAVLLAACLVMLPEGQELHETADVDVDGGGGDGGDGGDGAAPSRRDLHARSEGLANGFSRSEQMRSVEYIGLVGWFTVVVCPLQFYISAIGYQLKLKGDAAGEYSSIFSAAYGSVAIFAAYGGRVADAIGCGACQAFATISTAISFALLTLPKSAGLGVHVLGMTLYSLGRLFVFAMYFSNIGRRFGFEHYGTLCGLGLLISAVWSLLQYPMLAWAVDSNDATGANLLACAMLCATIPYTVWLGKREKLEREEKIRQSSERSTT